MNTSLIAYLNFFITLGSAFITGVFGWSLGGDAMFMAAVLAVVFFTISYLVFQVWKFWAVKLLAGEMRTAVILLPVAVFFFAYDVVTNYGAGALYRAEEANQAVNQNVNARNARAEVTRLEKRISDIRATTAWQGTYNAPEAYQELITSANEYIRLEEARGGCGPKCEARMRERDELIAAQANARKRAALKAEMLELEGELKAAKARVFDTPSTASAALTHATNFGAFFTGQLEPDESVRFWSNNGLTAFSALATTLAGIVSSVMLGLLGYAPPQREPWFANAKQIAADTSRPNVTPKSSDALPLRSVTIQSNGREFESDREIDRLLAKLNERIA